MADLIASYPLVGFHFTANFAGIGAAGVDARFMEIGGLTAELEYETLVEAGNNRFTHKLPLRTKYPNLMFKRGLPSTGLSPLTIWANAAIYYMEIFPIPVQVLLLNSDHLPVKGWNFTQAYPIKIEYSNFNAKENAIVVETLELAYQFVTPITP